LGVDKMAENVRITLRDSLDEDWERFITDLHEDFPSGIPYLTFTSLAEIYNEIENETDKQEYDPKKVLSFLCEVTFYLCHRFRDSDSHTTYATSDFIQSLGESISRDVFDFHNRLDEFEKKIETIESEQQKILRNQQEILGNQNTIYLKLMEMTK
jgi:hypothetical protein